MGATPALTPAFPALVVTSLWNFPQFHSSHTLSAAFSTPWSAHLPIPIPFVLQHLWFPAGHRSKGERRTLGHKEGTGLRVTGDPLAGIQRCLNPRTPSTYSLAAPSWSAPPPRAPGHHTAQLWLLPVAWGLAPAEDGRFGLSATLLSLGGARDPRQAWPDLTSFPPLRPPTPAAACGPGPGAASRNPGWG